MTDIFTVRKMKEANYETKPVDVDGLFLSNPKDWLEKQAAVLAQKADGSGATDVYLLSFHDDGVVWGKMKTGSLIASAKNDTAAPPRTPSPEFRSITLQECRVFSEHGELLIWRKGDSQFTARRIVDSKVNNDVPIAQANAFDESQVLWGREIAKIKNGTSKETSLVNDDFSVVSDGEEGLWHAFPRKLDDDDFVEEKSKGDKEKKPSRMRPLRLQTRHYLAEDEEGCAYITLSRLVGLG